MTNLERVRDAASIVVVGAFAPGVFTPDWLADKGLIQKVEAQSDEISMGRWILSPDIAQFRVNWLFLQVLPGRFMAATETPDNFPLLRDLVQSVFSFFPHTPALQIGLNRDIRFAIPSVDEWHQIGHTLAPKDVWKKHLSEPGMLSLTMHSPRSDKRAGHVQVSVKPMKTTRPYEVEVAYNSHVDLPPKSTMDSSLNDVTSEWDIALNAAEALAVDVISRAMRVPIQ